ncbi:anti-sigma factor family protein [Patulibacter minatonensis]|uniref:anti-sigma factor family protein n=1 Tax=Patulibacter minatonensis TaxID=298163 RepID=UPI00047B85CC|nr:zf-HC2 domain-containing protein [Patulibacter minatonensis]
MTTLPEMPCAEFVERVTDHLEGALSIEDEQRLQDHLAACAKCAHYLQQLRDTLELTGELREDDVTPEMRGELRDVFARWRAERS